jgi:OOP family OmpA-OmpF porin
MNVICRKPGRLLLIAMLAAAAPGSLLAQQWSSGTDAVQTTVIGTPPADISGMPEGPEIEGFISSRTVNGVNVTDAAGTKTPIAIGEATEIRVRKGLFGVSRSKLGRDSLLNGLPVTVKTVRWSEGLVASQISFKNSDLKTAAMIQSGTAQRFDEQGAAIDQNTAATEALRGRLGDIDKYNIKRTENVYFDTGKWNLSASAKSNLCYVASEADAMDNALLLVVGYTDSVGSQEYNQILSERRAGSVVNYLQQACSWKPWRMLTPTGMAEADPQASNDTASGKAQNRRVSVNILVSKSLDGM